MSDSLFSNCYYVDAHIHAGATISVSQLMPKSFQRFKFLGLVWPDWTKSGIILFPTIMHFFF